MSINLNELKAILKSVNPRVYRDQAPKNTDYPYIVYSNISIGKKKASSKLFKLMPLYQVSLFTLGTESDVIPLEKALSNIPHPDFFGVQGDENDDTVTNFYTQVRVVEDSEQ